MEFPGNLIPAPTGVDIEIRSFADPGSTLRPSFGEKTEGITGREPVGCLIPDGSGGIGFGDVAKLIQELRWLC